jgi:hypothetical protein
MRDGAMGASDPLSNKILSAVAALARDMAPDELSLRLAAEGRLPLSLAVRHAARFSIARSQGKGPLPAQVVARSSMQAMASELNGWLEQTNQEAGAFIDQWARDFGSEYRRQLPPVRCMQERATLGVLCTCEVCRGQRQVVCPCCGGAQRVQCTGCGGRGRVSCSACGGSRTSSCSSCGGSGTMEVRTFEATPNQMQESASQYGAQIRRVSCSSCGGRGGHPCSACYDGTQGCSGCTGTGLVNCSRSGARGVVPCEACAATGVVHHTGRIHCDVARHIDVQVSSTIPEDRETMQSRVPFDQIGSMASPSGGVQLMATHRIGHAVTLNYTASVSLECAQANFAGQSFVIRAYGPEREIFDYHNIVGKLLDADTAGLETALQGSSLFGSGAGSSLAGATQKFLASEVNALIAEAPAERLGTAVAAQSSVAQSPSIAKTLKGALLMAPLRRRFRRAGVLLKIVIVLIAFPFIWSREIVANYLFIAVIGFFFEWRHRKNGSPDELVASPKQAENASQSEKALAALQVPIQTRLISAEYVHRASATVSKAVPRLYGPVLLPWMYGVGAGVLVASFISRWFLLRWSELDKEVALLLLTSVAWIIAEMQVRARLRAMLSPKLYDRLKVLFQKSQKTFRLFPPAAVITGWLIADFALRLYAHVRYNIPLYP